MNVKPSQYIINAHELMNRIFDLLRDLPEERFYIDKANSIRDNLHNLDKLLSEIQLYCHQFAGTEQLHENLIIQRRELNARILELEGQVKALEERRGRMLIIDE